MNNRLKKLQLNKKESTSSFILTKEASSSKLTNIISSSNLSAFGGANSPGGSNGAAGHEWDPSYEEVVVTIKKSERGFGFELRNGILIIAVYPSKIRTKREKKCIEKCDRKKSFFKTPFKCFFFFRKGLSSVLCYFINLIYIYLLMLVSNLIFKFLIHNFFLHLSTYTREFFFFYFMQMRFIY
jgi:hypothetical protein